MGHEADPFTASAGAQARASITSEDQPIADAELAELAQQFPDPLELQEGGG